MLKMKPGDVAKLIAATKMVDELFDKFIKAQEEADAIYVSIVEEINEAKEEVRGILDDVANEAEEYYDDKSEKWQESERGEAYGEWRDKLRELADATAEDVEKPEPPEINRPDWIDECAECEFSEFEF